MKWRKIKLSFSSSSEEARSTHCGKPRIPDGLESEGPAQVVLHYSALVSENMRHGRWTNCEGHFFSATCVVTDEAFRVVECVSAVFALIDAETAPYEQSTLRKSQSCGVSQHRWCISLHQIVSPVVCRVHVEQDVVAGGICQIVHVTVVWSQVIMRAIPQVQVLENMGACCRESSRCSTGKRGQVVEQHVHEGEAHIHFSGFVEFGRYCGCECCQRSCAATTSFLSGEWSVFPRYQIIDCG